ncbi:MULTISPECIES: hypothetical protein [Paenibacillus]|uniref:hypothetical protein n=1 Tax=Paenibacillus TaxID=44249 RepID=UPI00097B299D|nr:hypothetical protein [Paenibacillus peoriae]OMF79862.1 hypothetical protein BK145_12985 [Paenibacillus peoriae]
MLDMTDQQLNRWLAEYMGYTISEYKDKWGWLMCPNGDNVHESLFPLDELWGFVPNYCNDPAASLEVQAKAIEIDRVGYARRIMYICWGGEMSDYAELDDEEWIKVSAIGSLLTASPRERAEAAYMTLSIKD